MNTSSKFRFDMRTKRIAAPIPKMTGTEPGVIRQRERERDADNDTSRCHYEIKVQERGKG